MCLRGALKNQKVLFFSFSQNIIKNIFKVVFYDFMLKNNYENTTVLFSCMIFIWFCYAHSPHKKYMTGKSSKRMLMTIENIDCYFQVLNHPNPFEVNTTILMFKSGMIFNYFRNFRVWWMYSKYAGFKNVEIQFSQCQGFRTPKMHTQKKLSSPRG
jgi:hypothetical protein